MTDVIDFNFCTITFSPSLAIGTIHVRLSDKIFTQWSSSQCLTISQPFDSMSHHYVTFLRKYLNTHVFHDKGCMYTHLN